MAERDAQILAVDDDAHARRLVQLLLEEAGHHCSTAGSAAEAWACLRERPFELVLCDIHMPGQSGLELARHIIAEHPDTAVVMVTGVDDPEIGRSSLSFGAYGYLVKPYRSTDLLMSVTNALHRRDQERSARRHRDALERAVEDRGAELEEALATLRSSTRSQQASQEATVRRLARAIEFRSRETWQHTERMGELSGVLARRIGLDAETAESIRLAAPLHDVGKVAVPDAVLLKPGPLDDAEREQMQQHTLVGHDVLSGGGTELLTLAASIALTHHERLDGTGYPKGLTGDSIPVEGRVAAVADVFDALTNERVYRKALTPGEALDVMHQGRGSQFDAEVLDQLDGSIEAAETIRRRYADPAGV